MPGEPLALRIRLAHVEVLHKCQLLLLVLFQPSVAAEGTGFDELFQEWDEFVLI